MLTNNNNNNNNVDKDDDVGNVIDDKTILTNCVRVLLCMQLGSVISKCSHSRFNIQYLCVSMYVYTYP